jgi:hypothetical protein
MRRGFQWSDIQESATCLVLATLATAQFDRIRAEGSQAGMSCQAAVPQHAASAETVHGDVSPLA